MDELKAIFAGNLIRLRTEAGMTQAELGRQLNYSDKTISKWERAEALPDALVLRQMSELFHVTVDYLLSEHDQWEGDRDRQETAAPAQFSRRAVTAVSLSGIWTLTLLVFVALWIAGLLLWILFPCAVLASLITLLVLNTLWNRGRGNLFIVMGLVLSVFVLVYLVFLCFFQNNLWQLFLVTLPAEALVYFSFRIKGRARER